VATGEVLRKVARKMAILFVCGQLWLGLSGPASGAPPEDAATLNALAISLSKKGEFRPAIDIWLGLLERAATDYEYSPVLEMNIGRNYQKLGRFPEACWHLTRAVAGMGENVSRPARWLDQVFGKLGERHVKVLVKLGAGERLLLDDGEKLRAYDAPLSWWFLPGTVTMRVALPGGGRYEARVAITSGTREVVLGGPVVAGRHEGPKGRRPNRLAWALLATGVGLGISGGVTMAVAGLNLDDYRAGFIEKHGSSYDLDAEVGLRREWESGLAREVESYQYSSYVLWGAGAFCAGTAGILFLVGTAKGDDPPDRSSSWSPQLSPFGRGVGLELRF